MNTNTTTRRSVTPQAATTPSAARKAPAACDRDLGTFAPVSRAEQEVVVRLDAETGIAHISSAWPTRSRRLARIYGQPGRVSLSRDGAITCCFWQVPIRLISFRRPQQPRPGNPAALGRGRALR